MLVYVQDKDGRPLMPTKRCGKVRRLLRDKKAVVVEKVPFTIRLCYHSTSYIQPITIGIDAGTAHIGISATTTKKELYASQIDLRTDIVELISRRKELRKRRRHNLRYRKSRFQNRKYEKGMIMPSVKHKIDSHIKAIIDVMHILPIWKIIVEVAQFDTQKIKEPGITKEGYQNGVQSGFWNTREYILARDDHQCQHCKGKSKDKILTVHHIESRKTGGDAPNNLITLCKTCHDAYHKGKIELNIQRGKSLKDATIMGIMKWKLYNRLLLIHPNVKISFGYITKRNRIIHGLEKSHIIDAFIISGNFNALRLEYLYKVKQTRRHNRQIHKTTIKKGGRRQRNQAPFEVKGFRLFDSVIYNNKVWFISSRRSKGFFVIRDIEYQHPIELSAKKLHLDRVKRNLIDIIKFK